MWRRCAWVVAVVVVPVGNMNVLVDWMFECMNGSWRVPAVEVAPVLLTADAMVPLKMPHLSCACVKGVSAMDKEGLGLVVN